MIAESPRPLWAGRTVAVLAVALLALNLRTAVAALSPILPLIDRDIPLGSIGIGLLGMLPPLAFAVSGFVAPLVARRLGIEATLVLACLAMVAGPVIRATAGHYSVLVLGSVVVLAGMGFGNILLPPVIKRYFPDRIGFMTALYATLMSISASLPPLIVAPLAEQLGWRTTSAGWALFAIAAAVPWLVLALRRRRQAAGDASVAPPAPALLGQMARSRTAWAIALAFLLTSLNVYGMFAWLPEILVSIARVTAAQAGALLALYGIIGLPLALVTPLLAARLRNVGTIVAAGVVLFVAGYIGLLVAPSSVTWLWVLLIGAGPVIFPLCLTLINLRTRTHEASVGLSGFVQGIGYAVGSLGPLVVGAIHDATGSWTGPLLFLIATALVGVIPAILLARPSYVEDELARN